MPERQNLFLNQRWTYGFSCTYIIINQVFKHIDLPLTFLYNKKMNFKTSIFLKKLTSDYFLL